MILISYFNNISFINSPTRQMSLSAEKEVVFPTNPPAGCVLKANDYTGEQQWCWKDDDRLLQVWWYSQYGECWQVSWHDYTTRKGWCCPASENVFDTKEAAHKFWQEKLDLMGGQIFN
jgi:hypothetical protein